MLIVCVVVGGFWDLNRCRRKKGRPIANITSMLLDAAPSYVKEKGRGVRTEQATHSMPCYTST
jgi:hypothetical protein